MKKNILLYMMLIWVSCSVAAQSSNEATEWLKRTASTFEKAGGVKAVFRVEAFKKGNSIGTANGEIELKGDKFYLQTAEHLSWFDGKTQWTYLPSNDEVTISHPTEAELQSINPYALLSLYKKGYRCEVGSATAFKGKPVHEVMMTATDKKQDMTSIVLYINKESNLPVYIEVELRDGTRNVITINSYRVHLDLTDSLFVFNRKEYPKVEVIDLR